MGGRKEGQSQRRRVTMEAELGVMWGQGDKKCRWLLEAEKDCPLKPLDGTQVCQHLDLSPVKLISDF